MQTTKVYWAPGNYLDGPQLRLNPGEAKDYGGGAEYELIHDCDLNKQFETRYYIMAYRIFSNDHNLPWALSEEEANRIADEAGIPPHDEQCRHMMTAELKSPYLKPIALPTTATLYKNDRGLFCRLNLRPDLDGNGPGKIFFPDRSCTAELCEGPCVIAEIKDKGNYGFFKGHMQQFKAPTDEALDDYLREHNCLYDYIIRYMKGKFGNYIYLIMKPSGWSHGYIDTQKYLVQTEDGKIEEHNYGVFSTDKTATITKEISVADYLCKGYHGCSFDNLMNKFVTPVFQVSGATQSNKFVSHLFDDAVDAKFLQPMQASNIFFVNISRENLIRSLMDFSREEMSELIRTVNKINQEANTAIKGKIKRGQISIC